MNILAGDIGGTKTLLRLARLGTQGLQLLHEMRYPSADYDDLDTMVANFLAGAPEGPHTIAAACFAIAGPVQHLDDRQLAQLTNLPWHLDSRQMADNLHIPRLALINDFAGIGHGLSALPADSIFTLQEGTPVAGAPRLVVGAGTGLGVCTLCETPDSHPILLPAEAGHASFSPADLRQLELARYVFEREGRCTREHLCSGSGLRRIYAFVCDESGLQATLPVNGHDAAATISEAALSGKDPLAVEALSLFVNIYAGQAADLALAVLPFGGVYLAGGIAPKILRRLGQPDVLLSFTNRPPMAALLSSIPLHVLQNEQAGLIGAMEYARRLARDQSMR